jgi:hypothetical protein
MNRVKTTFGRFQWHINAVKAGEGHPEFFKPGEGTLVATSEQRHAAKAKQLKKATIQATTAEKLHALNKPTPTKQPSKAK